MSNLLASFNAGVSGLHSAQASLSVTAHNMSNARTEGYTRQQVMVTDSFYQNSKGVYNNLMQVGTGTVIAMTRQVRNEFLDVQYRLQLGRESFYEENRKATMEIEDMLGELNGEQFSENINSLWQALSALANSADSLVDKEELVSMSARFIKNAQVLQEELDAYQTSLNTEVKKQVDAINNAVTEIQELNELIRKYEATGDSANDYRDKRNMYLDELAQYINIDAQEEIDGTVNIYAYGRFLLDQSNQSFLTTAYQSTTSRLLKPIWADSGENLFYSDSLAFSAANDTDIGSLRGLLVARGNYAANYTDVPVKPKREDFTTDQDYNIAINKFNKELEDYNNVIGASAVMTAQSQLDTLMHGIVTIVNDTLCPNKEITIRENGVDKKIHVLDEEKALVGDDENDTIGTELFSRRSRERYTEQTVTVVNADGTTSQQTLHVYNEEDPDDIYSLYTLSQLVVNPTVLRDASTIPSVYNQYQEHPGGYATNELMSIANAFNEDIGTLNPNSETTYNVFNFYGGMVSQLGVTGGIYNSVIANQEMTVTTLDNERQIVMGVSTDEELSNLIKYQQCYNASSRYITTVSQMLEYLIEKLGG